MSRPPSPSPEAAPLPPVPAGFTLAGVHCGIKRNPTKPDLTLIVAAAPAIAAGVYTQNRVCAAPVVYDRQRTPSDAFRVLVVNSGNANACTGERGDKDAATMAAAAAEAVAAPTDSALVFSTGVIGEYLPMDKIAAGIRDAAALLGDTEAALLAAARGMLTTDTVHKVAGRAAKTSAGSVQITGLAKGAAMIGPNMATMLAAIMTDARLQRDDAQRLLAEAVDETFNCISVEGHTSTNDSVVLLASGRAGGQPLAGDDLAAVAVGLREVCTELAKAIPADGEGATHLLTIDVRGAATREEARIVARTVGDSPLVKTAIAGADPNWGRIVSAVGYANATIESQRVTLAINGHPLYAQGTPLPFDEAAVSQSIRAARDTHIEIDLGAGDASVRFWTSDLTTEYVRLNADYRT